MICLFLRKGEKTKNDFRHYIHLGSSIACLQGHHKLSTMDHFCSWGISTSKELIVLTGNRKTHACCVPEGYKSPYDEDGAENVILEGEESQAHVGEDEILS